MGVCVIGTSLLAPTAAVRTFSVVCVLRSAQTVSAKLAHSSEQWCFSFVVDLLCSHIDK